MPTANELRTQVWDAMNALPKPVSRDTALNTALAILTGQQATGQQATQFSNWWEKNGDATLVKLNAQAS